MAKYVVYVNVDQIRTGTERSVIATLVQNGFLRATRRDSESTPLATLLFMGDSLLDEIKLARHLEKMLFLNTSYDVHVIVFQMAKLRSQPAVQLSSVPA